MPLASLNLTELPRTIVAYFSLHEKCHHYPDDWERLLRYIRTGWQPDLAARLPDLSHHIEAKALYVLTLSRHLIARSEAMAIGGNWKPVFIEAMMLLFPMLEIVGEARLGDSGDNPISGGLDWLGNPLQFPTPGVTHKHLKADNTRLAGIGKHMTTLPNGPRVREFFHLRNYLVHGLKNQRDRDFDIGAVRTSMNYEMPLAVVLRSKECLVVYWSQLTDPNPAASAPWIERLAAADIYPFGIMGSTVYEEGLIDPDILEWESTL